MVILPFTTSLWTAVLFSTIFLTISFYYISLGTQLIIINNEENEKINEESNIQFVENRSIIEKIKIEINKVFGGLYESFFIIYGMSVLQPLPESAEYSNNAFRNLLTWILLQTLLISTAYVSGLSSIMTLPQYKEPIKTRQDLIDSNIEWGSDDRAWIHTIEISNQVSIFSSRHHSNFDLVLLALEYIDKVVYMLIPQNTRRFSS